MWESVEQAKLTPTNCTNVWFSSKECDAVYISLLHLWDIIALPEMNWFKKEKKKKMMGFERS